MGGGGGKAGNKKQGESLPIRRGDPISEIDFPASWGITSRELLLDQWSELIEFLGIAEADEGVVAAPRSCSNMRRLIKRKKKRQVWR